MEKNLEYFITKASLYEKINLSGNKKLFEELTPDKKTSFQIDMFCPKCGKETPFHLAEMTSSIGGIPGYVFDQPVSAIRNYFSEAGGYSITLRCGKNKEHLHLYIYKFIDDYVIKFGQYPSLADLEIFDTKKYSKILSKDYKDYTKAIGLHAHGVGAGSYVYLRRIFENLIYETYEEAIKETGWACDDFLNKKMSEKIDSLKHKLPSIMTQDSNLYKILSKGIHELDEQTCLTYFPVLRAAIEMVLDEKLRKKEEEKRLLDVQKALNAISADLS